LSKFRKKGKEESLSPNVTLSFFEWVTGKDFFAHDQDPWKRTQKLLSEIQKRSLAEQVLLLSWDPTKMSLRVLKMLPPGEKSLVDSRLQVSLIKKVMEENKFVLWEDIWEDERIREQLKQCKCDSLMVFPLCIKETLVDVLLVVNYSTRGDAFRVTDCIAFISSVLALSLQNTRLYLDLKKKNAELKNWMAHVEERIEEGTKKLLEKEFQYYTLFEGANDGILLHDVSGKLIEANKVACRLLGYDKNELLKLNWNKIASSHYYKDQISFFNRAMSKEKITPLETVLHRKDGSFFDTELSSQKVRFRGKEIIQTFMRDISLRKRLQENLHESKEKYRILVESSLVGVFIIRKGIIQFVNGRFEKMTGCSKYELLETNFFDLIVPDQRSLVEKRETQRENEEKVPDHYEVEFLKKGGGKFWGEVHSCRIVLDGVPSILGNVIDITMRKQLAAQLLETQKLESLGTLAGGIAHDFNNLLGGILGYASLLLSEMNEQHPYYQDVYSIAETAKRAAELTNRLLAFARGGKYQVSSINMNRIIKEVIGSVSDTLQSDVAIETSLEEHVWPVRGDAKQIHKAILNICMNSLHAIPNEGKIVFETANVTLDESFAQNKLGLLAGDYVCIKISDTGVGMDEKTRVRVFEPFFTTRPQGEGTGLGLAMVYGVIKNHEGSILIDSELGKGTLVTIYLPRWIEKPEKKTIKPKHKEHVKILLVDDEKVIREVGRRMLEKGGFEVSLAGNGMDALNIYKKEKENIDLVLLDLIMPEMGGKETYRRLKEIDPDVAVCFTSGYGPYDRPEFMQFGQKCFIQKPFQTETLIQKIQSILETSEKNP